MALFEIKIIENSKKYEVENYNELLKAVTERADHFKNMVVTDDAIREAKQIKADLNGFIKRSNDYRLAKEREHMETFNPFKNQVKTIVDVVNQAVANIDGQIKVYEEIEKAEKKARIKDWYAEFKQDDEEVIADQFDTIFQTRWLNKTCSDAEWQDEIEKAVAKLNEDLNHLIMIVADPNIAKIYWDNKNFQGTLNEWQRFKKLQEPKAEPTTEKSSTVGEYVIAGVDMGRGEAMQYEIHITQDIHAFDFKYYRVTLELTFDKSQLAEFEELVKYLDKGSIANKVIKKEKI